MNWDNDTCFPQVRECTIANATIENVNKIWRERGRKRRKERRGNGEVCTVGFLGGNNKAYNSITTSWSKIENVRLMVISREQTLTKSTVSRK